MVWKYRIIFKNKILIRLKFYVIILFNFDCIVCGFLFILSIYWLFENERNFLFCLINIFMILRIKKNLGKIREK